MTVGIGSINIWSTVGRDLSDVRNFYENTACLTVENLLQVDPKTTESLRGASMIMTEKEAKLAKEYQALKDRNQLMEAQLESMRYRVRPA